MGSKQNWLMRQKNQRRIQAIVEIPLSDRIKEIAIDDPETGSMQKFIFLAVLERMEKLGHNVSDWF